MNPILVRFLGQALVMLMVRILNPDEDTQAIETEIVNASDEKTIKEIAIREAVGAVAEVTDEPTAELVADLVVASTTGNVEEVVEKHKGNILTHLIDFVWGILGGN